MTTSKFLVSTLIAAAAMTATAYADTTVGTADSAITYAGNIYTFGGWDSTNFHNGGWIRNTVDDSGNIVNSEFGGTGEWRSQTSDTFPSISSMFNNANTPNTVRFVQAGSVTIGDNTQTVTARAVSVSFNSLNVGGLIVEEGATGNSIVQSGSRSFYFRTGTETSFVGTINENFTITAGALKFEGNQDWVIAENKLLDLNGATLIGESTSGTMNISGGGSVDFGSSLTVVSGSSLSVSNVSVSSVGAIVNNGTVSFESGASLALTGLKMSSFTGLDGTKEGLQDVAGTYSFATGTGTVSGLGTDNLTINGSAVSSVNLDAKTASLSSKVYNISSDSSVVYDAAGDIGSADAVNVLGSLSFGDLSDGEHINTLVTGTGKVSISKSTGNHDSNVNLGTSFAGTVVLSGHFNPSRLTLGSSEGTVELDGVWFWGSSATFDKTVLFTGTADVSSTMNCCQGGGMTFNKGATFKEGAKFSINGNSENWGAFTLEKNAQASISGDFVVSAWSSTNGAAKTLTLKEGATLNVSGTLADNSGLNLTNDGTINVGNLRLASGSNDTISGTGTINAAGVLVDNNGTYSVTVKRLNIGASGITAQTNVWGYKLVFGDMTVGASADWKAESSDGLNGHVYLGSTENGGTKFDTNGFSISIGTTLSDQSSNAVGALTKVGAGTLTLSSANSYSGGTTISAGTLVAGANSALGDASGAVTISGGQLSISQGVTLAQTAITIVLSDAYNTDVEGTIAAIAGAGSLTTGTTITLEKAADAVALALVTEAPQKYSYQIFDPTSSLIGTDWTFELGSAWDGWEQSYDTTSGVLTLTIPEPSAFGLLAGVGALALVVSRRKRRK